MVPGDIVLITTHGSWRSHLGDLGHVMVAWYATSPDTSPPRHWWPALALLRVVMQLDRRRRPTGRQCHRRRTEST